MSANMLSSSLTDENRHLGKQIGCMNGVFQLFDRRHFLAGCRRMGADHRKRLLLGSQHQLESHNATKATIEKDQKEKPRLSTESFQTSYSSSSCSSTFSSLDYNKTAQPPRLTRRKTKIQITAIEEQHPSLTKGLKPPDIRDVVMDSMHREARSVSIKSFSSDERKVTIMKHIDSPRPLHQLTFEKKSNDDRSRLTLPRSSYDARESRDAFRTSMKYKELPPRLSLDSSMKSSSALESRLSFLGKENEFSSQVVPLHQESGGHHSRSSSIVAKLMGLDDFPDAVQSSPSPNPTLSKSYTRAEGSKQKHVSSSKPAPQKSTAPSSPRLRDANSVEKRSTCSRVPVEPAPWKRQESRKAPTSTSNQSSTVYGEIEKRITELEFKRSGKDLRALKQILEAMQKTRDKLENHRRDLKACSREPLGSPVEILGTMKLQFIQTKNPANRENTPRNNKKEPSQRLPSVEKTTAWKDLQSGRTLRAPQHTKVQEKLPETRKQMDLQLSYDQLSELSSENRHSNYQSEEFSDIETKVLKLANLINTNIRGKKNSVPPAKERASPVELTVTVIEQPSPVSVLDATFYSEDSPSPVKNISTPFRDESLSRNEAEWRLDFTEYDLGHKYNYKPESMLHLIHEPRVLKNEDNEIGGNHNGDVCLNPDHRYITKILQSSGLFKETSIVPTADQLLSSCPLINPDMFHALEETEEAKLSQKMERKVVFDAVNEVLVRRITSGRRRIGMKGIIKEVYLEMDYLCKLQHCNLDNEDDESIRLLAADMRYQSDEWTYYGGNQVPALILDVERLIFKDLINEVVTSEVVGLHDLPNRHCRQLFTKCAGLEMLPFLPNN